MTASPALKSLLLTTAFLALAGPGRAESPAYQALNHLLAEEGPRALENVILIEGGDGHPHPGEWLVYQAPSRSSFSRVSGIPAHGPIRTGEAPPEDLDLGPHPQAINFSLLNLDSNAAWKIAKKEARKENFSFDRVDYALKFQSQGGVPAWSLRLYNEKKSYLGELTISGATGEILRPLKLHKYTVEDLNGQETLVMVEEPWIRRAVRSVGRWFSQTGTAYGHDLLQAAGTAEDILVEQRTRDFSEDVH